MSFRLFFVAAFSLAVNPLNAWQSQLLPFSSGQYLTQTVNFNGMDWELLDYSYSGYRLSNELLGQVPCNVFDVTGSGNITAELQADVDAAIAAGGGIVRIPAGTFTVDASIAVDGDNVSIEGAGKDVTVINVPSTYTPVDGREEGLFTFGIALGGWRQGWPEGTNITAINTVTPRGSMSITAPSAASVSSLSAGDWVVLRQCFWTQLVNDNSAGLWPTTCSGSDRVYSFTYLRQVMSVVGAVVNIDAPIPMTLDPADNAVNLQQVGGTMRENLGVSGLTINFADNTNGDGGRPGSAGVYFEGVRDGWAYDVKVTNIPRDGIFSRSSARLTILECDVDGAQDYGGGGYGYGYQSIASQNVLIRNSTGNDTRHNYVSSYAMVSYLIYTGNSSDNSTQADDTHHSFQQAVVWDNHTLMRGALFNFNRTAYSGNAYETLESGVVWNFHGDGNAGLVWHGGEVNISPGVGGQAMVVGTDGLHQVYDNTQGNPFVLGDLINSPAMQVGTNGDRNVLYEGVTQPGLQPASLVETQLLQRTGMLVNGLANVCNLSPTPSPTPSPNWTATATPSVTPSPSTIETNIFDSDNPEWARVNWASGTYDFDDATRNHTTAGSESAMIDYDGLGWGAADFRAAAPVNASNYDYIEFWVWPGDAALEFRVRLRLGAGDVGTYTLVNSAYVGGWATGAWNYVQIPIANYAYGGDFDVVLFSSNDNSTDHPAYWLDDVHLVTLVSSSPTPSSSPSASSSASPTPSQTRTSSATPSSTPTATGTGTPSETGSSTPSETASATPSSATQTATPTVTQTATATVSSTPSSPVTASPSPTMSWTGTTVATSSRTVTASHSPTASPTPSTTPSASNTSTASLTATQTVSRTSTSAATFSQTATVTPTPTASWTSTFSFTQTVTLTSTPTPSVSVTLTVSLTPLAVPATPTPSTTVTPGGLIFNVYPENTGATIDRLTYGSNQYLIDEVPFVRHGGNRTTGYNWENNASNAGNDWGPHSADFWLLSQINPPLPQNAFQAPAAFMTGNVDYYRGLGAVNLVTLQMAGYVSADGASNVVAGEEAPSSRWKEVVFAKGAPFDLDPDDFDNFVYMDEEVNFFVDRYGPANAGGIRYYSLDNEPVLWANTHPMLFGSVTATYADHLQRSIDLTTAVLNVDPGARFFGPAYFGWSAMMAFGGPPDAWSNNATYGTHMGYYLARMRQESIAQGRRLLHFLDLHWYSEATDGSTRVAFAGNTQSVAQARMQATRSLWDPTYVEDSWITSSMGNQAIRLLPRVQQIIDTWYPGTRIAVTEWNFGGENHISGGIAEVDALGWYGRYGAAAARWDVAGDDNYAEAAYRAYLNYDGSGSAFGDLSVNSNTNDWVTATIHAARDSGGGDRITVVVANKDWNNAMPARVNLLGLAGGQTISSVQAWRFDSASPSLDPGTAPVPMGSWFEDTLPALSVTVYEIRMSAPFAGPTATVSPTPPPPTPSPTVTATPGPGAGDGMVTLSPASAAAGDLNASLEFAFTAGASAFSNGLLTIQMPSFIAAQLQTADSQSAGYVEAFSDGTLGAVSVSGDLLTLPVASLGAGQALTVRMGSQNLQGQGGVELPAAPGAYSFVVSSAPTGGAPAALAVQPSLTLAPYEEGPLEISQTLAAPNPAAEAGMVVMVELQGSADEIQVRFYTQGMAMVAKIEGGPFRKGWARIPVDTDAFDRLPSGLVYFSAKAFRDEAESSPMIGKLYVAR